jgi:PAS domain S-box-containing protein
LATIEMTDVAALIVSAAPRARTTREKLAAFSRRRRELSERNATWIEGQTTPVVAPEVAPAQLVDDLRRCDLELTLAEQWLNDLQRELEKTYELLERAQAKYFNLFDGTPDAYVMTDAKGTICDANSAAAALLEMAPRALAGKLLISFVARGDTRLFREGLRSLTDPAAPRRLLVHLRPRGKRPFGAVLSVATIPDARGHVIGHRWTIQRQ